MTQRNLPTTLLSPKNVLRIGVWNIRTMYQTGRAAQVAREMDRYGIHVLGLSEVRWTTAGKVTLSSGHTLLFSGPPDEGDAHRNGVGLMLSRQSVKSLMEWEPDNERILTARFKSKFQEVTVVQCYAPTNVADQESKEDFYECLQGVLDRTPKRDITIVMGNMNA